MAAQQLLHLDNLYCFDLNDKFPGPCGLWVVFSSYFKPELRNINLVARACPICSNNPYINSGPNILNSEEPIFFFTETVNWTKLEQQKYSVNKLYHISICFFSHVTKFEKNWENEELFFNFAAVIICNFKSVLLQTIPDVIFAYLIFLVM